MAGGGFLFNLRPLFLRLCLVPVGRCTESGLLLASNLRLVAEQTDRILEKDGRIVLTKNNAAQVGNDRIVYRGSYDGALYMDLYVLQLDPHYGYPHRIDEHQARKGFRLGDHAFQVLAASDGKISLKRL